MKLPYRAALLALAVFAAAAHAQGASKAKFLVARPGMPDPNFRETVVLVAQSENTEATGVIHVTTGPLSPDPDPTCVRAAARIAS